MEMYLSFKSHGIIVQILKENYMYVVVYLSHQVVVISIKTDVTKKNTAKMSQDFQTNDGDLSFL